MSFSFARGGVLHSILCFVVMITLKTHESDNCKAARLVQYCSNSRMGEHNCASGCLLLLDKNEYFSFDLGCHWTSRP
ncbi:hypothetical protein SAICODRAFT_127695 [Saitoella complicata NRRL Y-17804]|uniref:uncharacterized protein n=1 Tax=Saitoella complicata (strain BCRC 22490 / CBS 7301 / JCM 7358 / NBRC 10748 / NRRL Y-17804) TaxID=698492 RepID=UPI000866F930|nr:uncharacterized protein SAICODRAFT_127695 [Saitoella complicata NRRL Y-17804]ODQ52805.1 hypothetical protein SAICODRAFT_127695 [Saitoella complicata NRRL Y-17804]